MQLIKDKITGLLGMSQARRHSSDGGDGSEEGSQTVNSSDFEYEYISTALVSGPIASLSEVEVETWAKSELVGRLKKAAENHARL